MSQELTQPFFELQIQDFSWKFIWTIQTNYEKIVRDVRRGGGFRGGGGLGWVVVSDPKE